MTSDRTGTMDRSLAAQMAECWDNRNWAEDLDKSEPTLASLAAQMAECWDRAHLGERIAREADEDLGKIDAVIAKAGFTVDEVISAALQRPRAVH